MRKPNIFINTFSDTLTPMRFPLPASASAACAHKSLQRGETRNRLQALPLDTEIFKTGSEATGLLRWVETGRKMKMEGQKMESSAGTFLSCRLQSKKLIKKGESLRS
jgi:hypothetical protein